MLRPVSLIIAFLLVASIASADTLVTWQSTGAITLSQYNGVPPPRTPPVGTPYQLTMSWDASSAIPTGSSPAGSNCLMVNAAGSIAVGSMTYGLTHGLGFTQALLPGSNCSPGAKTTQFLFRVAPVGADPWVLGLGFMEVRVFNDLLLPTFPVTPSSAFASIQFADTAPATFYLVQGVGNVAAVVAQPTPVPEPATMTLVGLGLAAVVRSSRRRPRS